MELSFKCPKCGKEVVIEVSEEDYKKYETGNYLIQDCFPYLAPWKRELFISGLCKECWNEIFKYFNEEDL